MRFLTFSDLREQKGIPGSKVTIWRKERDRKFPKRTRMGDRFYGWPEHIIDAYSAALTAGHSEQEATVIAGRIRDGAEAA